MICKGCQTVADIRDTYKDAHEETPELIGWLTAEHQKLCEGHTRCDCQHIIREREIKWQNER